MDNNNSNTIDLTVIGSIFQRAGTTIRESSSSHSVDSMVG